MDENTKPVEEQVTSTAEVKSTPEPQSSKTPFYAAIVIVVIAVAVGAYIVMGTEKTTETVEVAEDGAPVMLSEAEAAEPAFFVNDVPVTRGQIADSVRQLTQQASFSGIDVSLPGIQTEINTEARTIAINNELLKQEATANVEMPSEEEIETIISQIIVDNGGEESFAVALEELGMTEETVRQNLRDSLLIESYLETQVTEVTVTEAQIEEMYNNYGGEEAGLPPLADVSLQIEDQLIQEGRNEQIRALLEELTEKANIVEAE